MNIGKQLVASIDALDYADQKIGHVWKMPTPEHCLRFAKTEEGEVHNDIINSELAGYARNNVQRTPDVAKELADTGMMLLKYLMSAYGYKMAKEMLVNASKRSEEFQSQDKKQLPSAFESFLKHAGIDKNVVSDLSIIGSLISYAMMLIETRGISPNVDAVVISTLFLIAGHELFADKPFSGYITEKVARTIEKVTTREMNIV